MKKRKTIVHWAIYILYLLLGVGLILGGITRRLDSFWSGMGGALLCIGALRMLAITRYKTNPQYKEQCDIAAHDERHRFLRMKAWSWTGYLFIFIAAAATILCKLLEQEVLMMAASGAVCLLILLYWVCYLILCRKY